MDLNQMRAKRKELAQQARDIHDKAEVEERALSVEESRLFDDLDAQVSDLSQRIDREERLRVVEEDQGRPYRQAERPDPQGENRREPGQAQKFRSFGEQLIAVARAERDPRNIDPRLSLRAVSGMSEGVPADAGFLVQTDFATPLLTKTYDVAQVASRVSRTPISGNANGIKMNGINETSRANGSRWGGVQVYWTAEAGDKTATAPKFRQIQLDLKKLTGLAYATDELLQDAAALESILMRAFSEEFAFRLDDAIINGIGGGQPLGILASNALVTVAAETGQLADTIVPENLVKMWSRCWGRSRLNAVWFINQDIEPQLFTMGLQVGLGGTAVYMPPGGLSQQPYGTLFGRPVIPIEQCATLGGLGDIILADMSQYILIEKGGIQSASSIHVRFVNDESVFRFVYRVDGQPLWGAALTPFSGVSTSTLSPFVTLAAR
jgi:HK97 family phage major capsid protein